MDAPNATLEKPVQAFNPKYPSGPPKQIGSSHLQAMHVKTRNIVKSKIETFDKKLEAIVRETLGNAAITLREASRAGPLAASHLINKLSIESGDLSMGDLDSATRTWDRMMTTSRRVLGMDEQQVGATINFNVHAVATHVPDTRTDALDVECKPVGATS